MFRSVDNCSFKNKHRFTPNLSKFSAFVFSLGFWTDADKSTGEDKDK